MSIWDSLVPKILDFANEFETSGLSQFLATYTHDEVSDGMYVNYTSCTQFMMIYYYYRLPYSSCSMFTGVHCS